MQKKYSTGGMSGYFLEHASDLRPQVLDNTCKVKILSVGQIQQAAEIIKASGLVAFPTETVYGLGANALDEKAILSIYQVKKRPLSDPIIVHVLSLEQALELVTLSADQEMVFRALTKKFWPGPLTFIGKANLSKIPLVVTAGTGFVGLRSPSHPVARSLIEKSGLPIGAPSANLFGHVSPTESFHVVNDFYDQDITVIEGQRSQLGLQSTVVKVTNQVLQVLRQGSLTVGKLQEAIRESELNLKIEIVAVTKSQEESQQSPGQMFRHYSPRIPCYYYDFSSNPTSLEIKGQVCKLSQSAFLSFSPSFRDYRGKARYYFSVGEETQNSAVADTLDVQQKFCTLEQRRVMHEVYFLLRKAQNTDAKTIIIGWDQQHKGPVWDKISRATENAMVYIKNDSVYL